MLANYEDVIGDRPVDLDVEGRGRKQAGDMLADYKDVIGDRPVHLDGEGRGREQAGDMLEVRV